MNLRTLSRSACAALLCAAAPAMAAAATPGSALATAPDLSLPAAFASGSSSVYPRKGRYVLVDAASQRLFMIEDGQVRDAMKVVVGKPGSQTPTLRSQIYYATLNPYWNVPVDLSQKLIAPRVLKEGISYLETHRYQVVTSFDGGAEILPPDSIDWQAVADGRETVHVRQLPGAANAMGEVKFTFPNAADIYLHDTPDKQLFAQSQRMFSNGCVRLEDAKRLGRWLIGQDLVPASSEPEQRVLLPQPVSVYITYLNDTPAGERMAAAGSSTLASR